MKTAFALWSVILILKKNMYSLFNTLGLTAGHILGHCCWQFKVISITFYLFAEHFLANHLGIVHVSDQIALDLYLRAIESLLPSH